MQGCFKQSLLKRFLNVNYHPLEKGIIWGKGGTDNDKMLIWISNLSQNLHAFNTDILLTLTFVSNLVGIGPGEEDKMLKAYKNNNSNKFRWEKLRWANKKMTDQTDRQTDTEEQTKTDRYINIHQLTLSYTNTREYYNKGLITWRFLCWVDHSLSHPSLSLFFIKVAVVFFCVYQYQDISVIIINILIQKCIILWLFTSFSCTDTSALYPQKLANCIYACSFENKLAPLFWYFEIKLNNFEFHPMKSWT